MYSYVCCMCLPGVVMLCQCVVLFTYTCRYGIPAVVLFSVVVTVVLLVIPRGSSSGNSEEVCVHVYMHVRIIVSCMVCVQTHTHVYNCIMTSFSRSLQLCVSCVAGCGHYILWTNHPTGSDGDIPGR